MRTNQDIPRQPALRPARHTLPWADERPGIPLSPSLRDELRRRVEMGLYAAPEVAAILARLLIDRGEV